MDWNFKKEDREKLTSNMVKNLLVLRATLGMTQAILGEILGNTRQTMVAIEEKKTTYMEHVSSVGAYVFD